MTTIKTRLTTNGKFEGKDELWYWSEGAHWTSSEEFAKNLPNREDVVKELPQARAALKTPSSIYLETIVCVQERVLMLL